MTYTEDRGLKVGDKIRYLRDGNFNPHPTFRIGDILTLVKHEGSVVPYFSSNEYKMERFSLERGWEKVEDVFAERRVSYDDVIEVLSNYTQKTIKKIHFDDSKTKLHVEFEEPRKTLWDKRIVSGTANENVLIGYVKEALQELITSFSKDRRDYLEIDEKAKEIFGEEFFSD